MKSTVTYLVASNKNRSASRTFVFIFLLTFFASPIRADIYTANAALSNGDYETAIREFTRLAEAGDDKAQAHLGYLYYVGEGVEQNYEKAVAWYRKAATQGNRDAQYNLAVSYAFGEGIKQDLTEAAIWYRRAAEQGHVVSQYSLGISYAYGEGVPQDQQEAARWFKMAAEQGYSRAQVHLGSMYHTGDGVEQDYKEAVRWYRMAADRGDATAQYNLGTMYRSGRGVEQNYAQAKRWFRQSADQGYAAAQNELASLERSAAVNVATRTIQEKPSLVEDNKQTIKNKPAEAGSSPSNALQQLVAQPTEKPAPTVETPVKQNTAPVAELAAETTTIVEKETTQEQTKKKPLFTVDQSDLLTLDQSELDIKQPEIAKQEEPVESDSIEQSEPEQTTIATEEPSIEQEVVVDIKAESQIADTEKQSEGFFSKLGKIFSADKSAEDVQPLGTPLADETPESIESVEEPDNNEIVATEQTNETIAVVEEAEAEAESEQAPIKTAVVEVQDDNEQIIADAPASAPSSANVQPLLTPTIDVDEIEIEESVIESEPITLTDEIDTADTEETVADIIDDTQVADNEVNTEDKPEGFFSRIGKLFSASETTTDQTSENTLTDTEVALADTEQTQEALIDDSDVEEPPAEEYTAAADNSLKTEDSETDIVDKNIEQSAETIATEPIVVEETILPTQTNALLAEKPQTEEVVVETDIVEAEQSDQKTGFFSRLGSIFKADEPAVVDSVEETTDTEIADEPVIQVEEAIETDITTAEPVVEENTVIAKLEENPTIAETIIEDEIVENDLANFSVDAGRRALINKDYAEAAKQFIPLAEAGDNEAQSYLGSLYYVGSGVEQDFEQSYQWYKKAAEQGNKDAQYSIGNMYLLGEGVEQDNNEAAKWYAMASEQGHIAASHNLDNLKKLEELNRQNQLRQEAIEAGQINSEQTLVDVDDADINEAPVELDEETVAEVEQPDDAISEAESKDEVTEEKKGGLAALFGGLFGKKEKQQDEELTTDANDITVEESEEPLDGETITLDNTLTEEPTEVEVEVEETVLETTTEEIASIEQDLEQETESSGFFDSLFGPADGAEPIALKSSEELSTREEDNDAATVVEESVDNEDNLNAIDQNQTETGEQPETAIADVAEDQTKKKKGFFSRLFSRDDEPVEDQAIDDNIEEEQIALAETDSDDIDPSYDAEPVDEEQLSSTEQSLKSLATQGDSDAQYQLGTRYYSGNETKQDFSQAALWYRRSAQQGNVDAQYSLGNMFLLGEGVDQDDNQAAYWYALAAEQGHVSASANLESLNKANQTSSVVTTSNTDRLMPIEDDTVTTSVSSETGEAEYEQGLAYAFGDGVAQNDRKAFEYFLQAADKGFPLAQYKVGVAYAYGEGVRQDYKSAANWYRKAAEQGYTIAQRNLATMYLNGNGIEKDKVQALAWYQIVAANGNAMDVRRRDMLENELTEPELSRSQEIAVQITSRLNNSPSL